MWFSSNKGESTYIIYMYMKYKLVALCRNNSNICFCETNFISKRAQMKFCEKNIRYFHWNSTEQFKVSCNELCYSFLKIHCTLTVFADVVAIWDNGNISTTRAALCTPFIKCQSFNSNKIENCSWLQSNEKKSAASHKWKHKNTLWSLLDLGDISIQSMKSQRNGKQTKKR